MTAPRLLLLLASLTALVAAAARDADPSAAKGTAAPDLHSACERARAAGRPVLVHFAARELAAGARLAREVFDEPRTHARLARRVEVVELDARAESALFERAFGQAGRVGCAFLTPDGEVVTTVAADVRASDLEAWCERVALRLPRWERTEDRPLARAELCLELFAWRTAAAEARRAAEAEAPAGAGVRSLLVLARALVRDGRVAEARTALDALPAAERACADAVVTRALAHLAGGEPRAALDALAALPAGGPADDERLLALATAHHDARDPNVLEPLRALLAEYPASPWRPDALRLLEHVLAPPADHRH